MVNVLEKYQYFNGLKFTRDDKTGYYLNSTIRKRMHRYVYEFYNGEIPKGYVAHHKDHNKANNNIENLELLTSSEHSTMHGKERIVIDYEKLIENLKKNARPKAIEWHKSAEGRLWHKNHCDSLRTTKEFICEICGKSFVTQNNGKNRFCSNNCKSRNRRLSKVDEEERICGFCGGIYRTNKYSKSRTCSATCANKLWHSRKHRA